MIIKNVVPQHLQQDLSNELKFNCEWRLSPATSGDAILDKNNSKIRETAQMVHFIIDEHEAKSHLAQAAGNMIDAIAETLNLDIRMAVRVKANLIFKDGLAANCHHTPHVDMGNQNCISAVYYVEDSDGDTLLFDKGVPDNPINLKVVERASPIQGDTFIFPSNKFHTSCSPVENTTRTVINFVLALDESINVQTLLSKID